MMYRNVPQLAATLHQDIDASSAFGLAANLTTVLTSTGQAAANLYLHTTMSEKQILILDRRKTSFRSKHQNCRVHCATVLFLKSVGLRHAKPCTIKVDLGMCLFLTWNVNHLSSICENCRIMKGPLVLPNVGTPICRSLRIHKQTPTLRTTMDNIAS